MNLDSILKSTCFLETLPPSGAPRQARVESVAGRWITAVADIPLTIGTAVQIETADEIFLADVSGVELTPAGTRALLDVQHYLSKNEIRQVFPHLQVPASRARAAGA